VDIVESLVVSTSFAGAGYALGCHYTAGMPCVLITVARHSTR